MQDNAGMLNGGKLDSFVGY